MVEADGIEPTTWSLQSYRSPNWATPPSNYWWAREDLNFRPHAYQARALTIWATGPKRRFRHSKPKPKLRSMQRDAKTASYIFVPNLNNKNYPDSSLERRWSSRRFPYGYLVTTSPQSLISPWPATSLRLVNRLQVKPTPMVWRAVCTRPGNVFTAACWSAITSDSNFMYSSCRVQSELR